MLESLLFVAIRYRGRRIADCARAERPSGGPGVYPPGNFLKFLPFWCKFSSEKSLKGGQLSPLLSPSPLDWPLTETLICFYRAKGYKSGPTGSEYGISQVGEELAQAAGGKRGLGRSPSRGQRDKVLVGGGWGRSPPSN